MIRFLRKIVLLLKASSIFFWLAVSVYIIEHWFVGLAGFSVNSEETMITGLEVMVVGFILIILFDFFYLRKILRIVMFDFFFLFFFWTFLFCYLMRKLARRNQGIFIINDNKVYALKIHTLSLNLKFTLFSYYHFLVLHYLP
jgi:hypothetical protein